MSTETTAQTQDKLNALENNSEKLQTTKFAVKGETVEVKETDEDLIVENVPVQALSQDRDGDKINEEGQKQVVEQLQSGEVPAFPNHGIGDHDAIYDFRDIMGQWIDGEHRDGKTFGTLRLRKNNEAAEHLKDLLDQDMPVGFSVGFIPKEFQETSEDGEIISGLDLMEVSPVGIPSNPDAVAELEDQPVAMAKSIMNKSNDDKSPEEFSKTFAQKLKNAMSQESETETHKDKGSKSDLVKNTKQISADEVDNVMEIINVHNEEMKGDIRTYMEENNLIEEDEEMDGKQFDEDEIEVIMGIVGGIWGADRRQALLDGLQAALEDDIGDEEVTAMAGVIDNVFDEGIEATREALEDENEENEESAEETDGEHDDEDDDYDDKEEDSVSGQTEDSEQNSESSEPENQDGKTEKESGGLSEDEKTLDDSDKKNTINTVQDENKDTEASNNEESSKSEVNDPFVITEDSRA